MIFVPERDMVHDLLLGMGFTRACADLFHDHVVDRLRGPSRPSITMNMPMLAGGAGKGRIEAAIICSNDQQDRVPDGRVGLSPIWDALKSGSGRAVAMSVYAFAGAIRRQAIHWISEFSGSESIVFGAFLRRQYLRHKGAGGHCIVAARRRCRRLKCRARTDKRASGMRAQTMKKQFYAYRRQGSARFHHAAGPRALPCTWTATAFQQMAHQVAHAPNMELGPCAAWLNAVETEHSAWMSAPSKAAAARMGAADLARRRSPCWKPTHNKRRSWN